VYSWSCSLSALSTSIFHDKDDKNELTPRSVAYKIWRPFELRVEMETDTKQSTVGEYLMVLEVLCGLGGLAS
jgi:hypothetical protein